MCLVTNEWVNIRVMAYKERDILLDFKPVELVWIPFLISAAFKKMGFFMHKSFFLNTNNTLDTVVII